MDRPRKKLPQTCNQGAEYRVGETSVTLYGRRYRAIVVHSSRHDRCQHQRLERDNRDAAVIAKAREQVGCFVLLSNVPAEGEAGYSALQVLASYKEHHGIEKNFGFLKDDALVNALFLKTPERLEALGLILWISLLIWRLMDAEMRRAVERTAAPLPGWDNKPTRRSTAYRVTIKFEGLLILKQGAHRRLARPLSEAQQAFLGALGLGESIFTGAPGSPGAKHQGAGLC